MLRYGDGTPFPFGEGFLDLLVDAVEACTTMLAATANLDHQCAEAAAALERIGEEDRRLVLFERAVAAACGAAPSGARTSPAVLAAEHTRSAMASAVERSREQLKQLSVEQASAPDWHQTARRVHAAAGRFFEHRALPGTHWTWSWDASGRVPHAQATSLAARFQVDFDLDVAPAWRAPVRIDTLVPDLVVHLPRRRWLRSPVEAPIPLGRCTLVRAHHDTGGRELTIRRPDGWDWRIELPHDGQPSATLLDRRGRPAGTGLVRETELFALVRAIDDVFQAPRIARHAREVLLDGVRVTELADTTLATRALLAELGPVVRSIRGRSQVPGELSLKRDISDNRREELYVSRTSLTASYANLPAEHRVLLDDAGFGRGFTTGLVELPAHSQPAIPAIPAIPVRPTPPSIPARRLARGSSAAASAPTVRVATLSSPPLATVVMNRRLLTPAG